MKLPRLTIAAAVGAGAIALTAAAFAQSKLTVVPSLQCPMGCGVVVYNVQLSNMMARNGAKVSLAPQETPGFMYNIRYMDEKYNGRAKHTAFGTEDMVLQLGVHGGQGLIKDSLPNPVKNKFQFLWEVAATANGRFYVTFDPKIKTIADMKGKKVDLGLLTQSDWGLSSRLVLEQYGINKKNTHINFVTPAVMTDQLINGTADVVTSVVLGDPGSDSWHSGGLLLKIGAAAKASGRKLHYISVSQKAIDGINKKYGTTLFTKTLKPGTLPGQEEPVTIGLNRVYMAVTKHFSPETGYQLVREMIRNGPALRKEGGLWGFWSKEGMVAGLNACNTNPGAIKAYKEAGVWDLRTKGGPVAKIPGCS
ncbi:MAG: TAXI family TRAP transporter solute-binding subunit [Pseudolabrys sp.]